MNKRWTLLLIATFTISHLASLQAGEIAGYIPGNPLSQATYDRFTGGYPSTTTNPTTPVSNSSPLFIGNGYSNNLSGVGWLDNVPMFSVSLVSERHFIGAAHVGYGAGGQINFVNASGTVYTATIQTLRRPTTTFVDSLGQTRTLTSDVSVGTFTVPIPDAAGIGHYRVLKSDVTLSPLVDAGGGQQAGQPSPPNFYDNRPMLNYGQNPTYGPSTHLGQNVLDNIQVASFDNFVNDATVGALYAYNSAVPGSFYAIGGDSGGPSFLPYNGELTLLGGHYANSGPIAPGAVSVDAFLPYYTDQVNAFMAMDTDATHPTGYSLKLIVVPEPGLLLVLTVFGLAFAKSRSSNSAGCTRV